MTRYFHLDQSGHNPIVVLSDQDSGPDHQAFIVADKIEAWDVDWTQASGLIALHTASRIYIVEFAEEDQGAACADAISLLCQLTAADRQTT